MTSFFSRPLTKKLKIGTRLLQVLLIPMVLALIVSNLQMQELSSWIRPAGLYLLFGSTFLYAAILLWMKKGSDHFALAALGAVIGLFYYLVVLKLRSLKYFPEGSARLGVFLISVLISFFCLQEFKGFEEIRMQTDEELPKGITIMGISYLCVCILFVASQLLNLTHISIRKVPLGEVAVLVSGIMMLLMQGVKWILMNKTAKMLGAWKSDGSGEGITQEFEVRQIRWIEYQGKDLYTVHSLRKKPQEIESFPFTALCDYLKKRDIVDLVPITDTIIINKHYIKDITLDENGDRFVYLAGEKKRFRVDKSYARDITWWNFEKETKE